MPDQTFWDGLIKVAQSQGILALLAIVFAIGLFKGWWRISSKQNTREGAQNNDARFDGFRDCLSDMEKDLAGYKSNLEGYRADFAVLNGRVEQLRVDHPLLALKFDQLEKSQREMHQTNISNGEKLETLIVQSNYQGEKNTNKLEAAVNRLEDILLNRPHRPTR